MESDKKTTVTYDIDMFKVEPEGWVNLAVFELFPCLLRAKQNEIKGL